MLLDITGEEEEDVELEQKGVKLYIKRGDRPFGDGMLGHVKLLSKRTTGEERIRASIAYYLDVYSLISLRDKFSFPSRPSLESVDERTCATNCSVHICTRRERRPSHLEGECGNTLVRIN